MQSNKILLWLVLIVVSQIMFCVTAGEKEGLMINFQQEGKTLEEVLSIVKAENKTGFIYFTLENCGPCKSLQKEVFKNEKAAEYINLSFVPFWIDTNKDTGPELTKHFNVLGFPTVVLIDTEGKILDKVVGYFSGSSEKYINDLKKIIEAGNSLIAMKLKYSNNPNDTGIALKYADKLYSANEIKKASAIYEDLIDKIKDRSEKSKIYINLANCYDKFDRDKSIEALERGLKEDVFGDKKEIIYIELGNLYFDIERSRKFYNLKESENGYTSAAKYFDLLPERPEDFKTFNKSEDDKRYILFLINRFDSKFFTAYFKAGYIDKGKNSFERLFNKAYNAENFMKLDEYLYFCADFNVYLNGAIPYAEKAVELSKWKHEGILRSYAHLLGKTRNLDKAITIQNKLIEISNNKTRDLCYLATLYLQVGKEEKAEQIIKNLYSEAKNDAKKLYNLAALFYENKINLNKALECIQKSVEFSEKENPSYLELYAILLYENGNIEKAIENQKKFYEIAIKENYNNSYKN